MASKRRLRLESLETRQLLAADVLGLPVLPPSEAGQSPVPSEPIIVDAIGLEEPLFFPGFPHYVHGADFIHEVGDLVLVVDSSHLSGHQSLLHTFERTADGGLQFLDTFDPAFQVEQMLIVGDNAVLLGSQWQNTDYHLLHQAEPALSIDPTDMPPESDVITVAVTVPLSGDAEPVRQEFIGSLKHVSSQGDNLLLITQTHPIHILQIYPPAPIADTFYWLEVSDGVLTTQATESIVAEGMSVNGDTILTWNTNSFPIHYFAEPGPNDPLATHETIITEYQLGEGAIEKVGDLKFDAGYIDNVNFSEDGTSATIVRTGANSDSGTGVSIEIVNLVGDAFELVETISLPEFAGHTFDVGDSFVLLHDYAMPNAVVLVDLSQDDESTEERVHRIDIGDDLELANGSLQLADGKVVLNANRYPEVEPLSQLQGFLTDFWRPVQDSVLLTLSTEDAEIIARSEISAIGYPINSLSLIDADAQRFGFFSSEPDPTGSNEGFIFGHLDDSGEFVNDGVVRGIFPWDELDLSDERLIARGNGRLVEFDWDNPDEPIHTMPLLDPNLPPIEAVDDTFHVEFPETDGFLHVLANDQLPPESPHVEIVDIIGAPEGTEIIGRAIRVPSEAFVDGETLRFEYVISNGVSTSTATVEVSVDLVSQETIDAMVQRVREQAAEDFGVEADEVVITFVEQLTSGIVDQQDFSSVGILEPGLLITLTVPDASAMYFIGFDAMQPLQLFSTGREFLVEIGIRAVDDAGNEISTVGEGQEFWIEVTAKDLRAFGQGVFSVFTDLELPENIELTEEVEFLDGFSRLQSTGSITPSEIDELGGYHSPLVPPGSDTQTVFRLRATGMVEGNVTLRPNPADLRGSEVLVYGDDTPVDASKIRFQSTDFAVVANDPIAQRDVNQDGVVTAIDALQVLNLINEIGNGTLEDLAARMAEGEDGTAHPLARFDTNGDNFLAPVDALIIVNWINLSSSSVPLPESTLPSDGDLAIDLSVFDDDEEDG